MTTATPTTVMAMPAHPVHTYQHLVASHATRLGAQYVHDGLSYWRVAAPRQDICPDCGAVVFIEPDGTIEHTCDEPRRSFPDDYNP